ncbi:MAG: type 2 isopentenyl-diphosphate Delta-isomerase [Eubacteriales bacterium]
MSRLRRKDEHIFTALKLAQRSAISGFTDVAFVHNALPEISSRDITLTTELFGRTIEAPLVINAITGGGPGPGRINEALAIAARDTGLAMAVGSQTIAVENPAYEESFKVVRRINQHGLVIANVSAKESVETALRAIDMISADALQVHLNAPQETAMKEGDRDFRGWLDNISKIVKRVCVPVIVKEVGFGLSYEAARRLNEVGVVHFDVGGRGGTNFIAIEGWRGEGKQNCLESWGITTAASLVETDSCGLSAAIIATGGITNGLDAAKALALGASAAGIAGTYLKILWEQSVDGLIQSIENTKSDLKKVLLMVGVNSPQRLQNVPVVITGRTREWLNERGINTANYARRNGLVSTQNSIFPPGDGKPTKS